MHLSQSTTFAKRRIGSRRAIPAKDSASHGPMVTHGRRVSRLILQGNVESTKHNRLRKLGAQSKLTYFRLKVVT